MFPASLENTYITLNAYYITFKYNTTVTLPIFVYLIHIVTLLFCVIDNSMTVYLYA